MLAFTRARSLTRTVVLWDSLPAGTKVPFSTTGPTTCRQGPMVRIQLPPAKSLRTFGPRAVCSWPHLRQLLQMDPCPDTKGNVPTGTRNAEKGRARILPLLNRITTGRSTRTSTPTVSGERTGGLFRYQGTRGTRTFAVRRGSGLERVVAAETTE